MKCATLTFHRTTNYGAVFQTYGLQCCLDKLGISNEVLDYRSPTIESRYEKPKWTFYLNVRNIVKIFLRNSYIRDNRLNFLSFVEKNIRQSDIVYTPENIEDSNKCYDLFIVGSDQVWNPECTGNDKNFLLAFAHPDKRYSYAASFGKTFFESTYDTWFSEDLSKFRMISVRELSGLSLVTKYTEIQPTLVVDPTLLIHKEWVDRAQNKGRIIQRPYVLIYLMKETSTIFNKARRYAKQRNLEIVYINDRLLPRIGIKNMYYVTPDMWLSLFYYADCVFTNSFHGTAFSVNLNKEFWVELLPPPAKVNSRMTDFLRMLLLDSRIITSNSNLFDTIIDYTEVNRILDNQRNNSIQYLKSIILCQ